MRADDVLHRLTIGDAAGAIRARRLSPVELARALLARIEQLNPRLDAFLTVTEREALSAARLAEKAIASGGWKGPLHGIPLAYKDIYETAGVRTTAHSRLMLNHMPKRSAAAVERLAEAGAVMLGKLATHEFAIGGPAFDLPWPPARNPWDTERFTGGSSSGSAAAIAAGLCLGSLGSDTGGSIRIPAAYCGIAGLKPTAGLVSRRGMVPLSHSLDTAGPMAWTAEDCAILLAAIAGHDPEDSASVPAPPVDYLAECRKPVKGMRVGLIRRFHEHDVPASAEVREQMADAVRLLRDLGCTVVDLDTAPLQDFNAVARLIITAEAYTLHEHDLTTRPELYSRAFRVRVMAGALLRAADYLQAQRQRRTLAAQFNALFEQVEVLVTASAASPPPKLADQQLDEGLARPMFTAPANVSGGPALVVCSGFAANGLPLGLQIVGRPFDDAGVLRLGRAVEEAAGTRARRPAL
ncbi:amidase [Elioraea sp. Yellowstone]|jgi:aspartyl-tRNA(Asn)/glutamyl-tRNA(Gln) amidotransferase subunit A|uniref:amidase n=1 Tax=Elioraea sp. Yellowstone TaxID=2592070 RepID=UPI0011516772|nr:amidase [Elioraea sp. Yellowstone]TQF76367.1 amidase [Elioraea sp. Yellowstone]